MSQTTIHDHFSPSNKYKQSQAGPSTATKRTPKRIEVSSSESEGSEGIEGIHLSAKGDKRKRISLEQQRRARRTVLEEDDDEEEDEGPEVHSRESLAQGSPMRSINRTAIEKSPAPPPALLSELQHPSDAPEASGQRQPTTESLKPPSTTQLRRSTRRPSPLVLMPVKPSKQPASSSSRQKTSTGTARTGSRSLQFSLELPSLSASERSSYTPWGVPAINSAKRSTPPIVRVVISDDDDDDDAPIIAKRLQKVAKARPVKQSSKGKAVAVSDSSSSSSTSSVAVRKKAAARPTRPTSRNHRPKKKHQKRAKGEKPRDPDDPGEASTEEEQDMKAELEQDEPERFKTKSRLRQKSETAFQRTLRKAKAKRLGIVESTTEEEDDENEDDDSASGNESGTTRSSESEDFIEDDGGEVPDTLLPHQFSHNATQTPEFKFKVVFHYLLYLIMSGPQVLPLRGDDAEYFLPHLGDIRRRMEGFKNGRVRSQIWPIKLVRALDKYPDFQSTELIEPHYGCDACNRRLPSRLQVQLGGDPYDRDSHQAMEQSSSSESEDESDDSGEAKKGDRHFMLGTFCHKRAKVYHLISHWEDDMYDRIRVQYHDLLRAKGQDVPDDSEASSSDGADSDEDEVYGRRMERFERRKRTKIRVDKLKQQTLPKDVGNVDKVLMWMDERRFQTKLFHILEDLVEDSRRLEHDTSRDQ